DIFEKLPEILFLGAIQRREPNAHPHGRCTASDDSVKGQALYPNLATRDPKCYFDFGAAADVSGGLYLASAQTGVGEISPERSRSFVDMQFYSHKTLDSGMPPSIL